MKRMTEDIDRSNQKVLETIDFLSKQTCSESKTKAKKKDEERGKDNVISEQFAENLAHETLEDAKLIVAV